MDRIKRFIDCYIPTETCNLRCHYCYITQKRKFNSKIAEIGYSPEYVRQALSKRRLGGVCLFNLCAGGETLLSDDVLPIVKELLEEGHYVMIVTNGTLTKRFDEVIAWPYEILKRLFFKFSFHYLEMKRLEWIDRFCSNVKKIKNAGISFTVEVTPSDELIPYIDELKHVCLDNFGALCHVTIARDDRTDGIDILSKYSFDEYKKIWGVFDSELFRFKSSIFYVHRNEFCYAGDWSLYLNLITGRLTQCYCGRCLGNIYEDIERPLLLAAVGKKCTQPHCYNGHAFLTLGDIPELTTPTYAEVRNRICSDGTEWLKPEMEHFMSTKLYESNNEYGIIKKMKMKLYTEKDWHERLGRYNFYKKMSSVKKRIRNKTSDEKYK